MYEENTTSQRKDGLTGTSPDVTSNTNQPENISTTSLTDGTISTISPDGTSLDSKPPSDGSTNVSTHPEVPDDIKDTTPGASTSGSAMVTLHSDVRSEKSIRPVINVQSTQLITLVNYMLNIR